VAGLNSHSRKKEDPVAPYRLPDGPSDAYAATRTRMGELIERLSGPGMAGCTQEQLEQFVTAAGRELQRQAIQDFLDERSRTEQRLAVVEGADGVARRRAERGHARQVATTVGRVSVARIADRAPGASNLHPADAELSLPGCLYSRPLQRLIVNEAAAGSLRRTAESVRRATGLSLSTRQIMQVCQRAALDARDFYTLPPVAQPSNQDLLVVSADATGVNMIPSGLRESVRAQAQTRADAGPRPPSAQLAERERTGRCRMATVTAVYDTTPVPRGGADVLPRTAAERAARTRAAPRAERREVHASLKHTAAEMITAMFDLAEQRDPEHRRRWIVLLDGNNHQIERVRHEAAKRGVHIDIIIDFVHVLEYLWHAAEDLHPSAPTRQAFVARTARDILDGRSSRVAAELRAHALAHTAAPGEGCNKAKATGLERAAAYLSAKEDLLGYDIALALGRPIATGVIEGCCRFLIKDRLDVTGARWSLPGAEAILLLRAVIDNGDFEAYWAHHGQREHERQHAARYRHDHTAAT
jgi:hypothetical protein